MVAGHSLVAVAGSGTLLESADRSAAVGRIRCSGTSYLIFEINDSASADQVRSSSTATDILTKRELQIALLIAEGKCDKEIARKLGISCYTVREHVRRTFAKLNISRRSAIGSHVLAEASNRTSG